MESFRLIKRHNERVLLTLTADIEPAEDLGYLLHKHPDRVQQQELPVGRTTVFYPEVGAGRCTVALLLEPDPVGLVRNPRFAADGFALGQYVNDRPYAASSMLAVALGRVFATARNGTCAARPELAATPLPLTVRVPACPSFAGIDGIRRLFGPLGWTVTAEPEPLDPELPEWGEARYADVELTGTLRLSEALTHLYVLLPVLDGSKHYWVGPDEIDKLLANASSWLPDHPERDLITRRYLAHRRPLVTDALSRLEALDDRPDEPDDDEAEAETGETGETAAEPLALQRRAAVLAALKAEGAQRVVDLGCGEGTLLANLLADPFFTEIVGADVAAAALERAARRLRLDRLPERRRDRITLLHTSVVYVDPRLAGYDAICLVEVVEHLDPDRLPALERTVFAAACPRVVVVTTPNAEYNPVWESLPEGRFRHPDHRFEWTRAEFEAWASGVAQAHGYAVSFQPVGPADPERGAPTQLAVFTR